MIPFKAALEIALSRALKINVCEKAVLMNSINRVLFFDVKSDRELPPYNRVAVDGYAIKVKDLDNKLKVIETVPAGYKPVHTVLDGTCIKVMTGAMMPDGAEMVVMVENALFSDGFVSFEISEKEKKYVNFSKKGEDIGSGETVLSAGTRVLPKHIATLSSVGCFEPMVSKKPKIAIIATGDEIIEPWQKPEIQQIRNSNSYSLITQCERAGAEANYFGIVSDKFEHIDSIFQKAVQEADIILLTGGVSMGDFDIVPDVLKKNNFEILFDSVAVKPGKPTTFAVKENKFVFGMPGNPLSTFVVFELFVRPFIAKMVGDLTKEKRIILPLGKSFIRKREEWVPVKIENGVLFPVKVHGSGHFLAINEADGLFPVEAGVSEVLQNTMVEIKLI